MDNLFDKLKLPLSKKRKGILRYHYVGNSELNRGKEYTSIYEVEEITTINDITKIRIKNQSIHRECVPEWINTELVEWVK